MARTPQIGMAAPAQKKYVPAYVVEKLEGTVDREMILYDEKGKKSVKTVKVDAGYLVKFPPKGRGDKGHSIRVWSAEELARHGFDQTIPIVDMEGDSDDPVSFIENRVAS